MNIYRTNKPFRILANAAFLSNIGSVMFNFVFMIYAQTLPFKTLALSLVTIANLLPTLVTMPSGYLADHTPAQRRFSFIGCGWCRRHFMWPLPSSFRPLAHWPPSPCFSPLTWAPT